jgi:hypothetical protein
VLKSKVAAEYMHLTYVLVVVVGAALWFQKGKNEIHVLGTYHESSKDPKVGTAPIGHKYKHV